MKNTQYKKGFTLIELLIAISIFMGFMMVASNAYLEIIRAQKTANETRLIYSELRDFVDSVDNQMREGGIDYFCYSPDKINNIDFQSVALTRCYDSATLTVDSGDNLRTISKDGLSSSIIKFIPPASDGSGGGLCQLKFRNVNGSWQREVGYEGGSGDCGDYQPVAFTNLKINSLRFEIYPKKDPKSAEAQKELNTQIQPMVRMYLDVGSKLQTVNFDLHFQTSLTARNN